VILCVVLVLSTVSFPAEVLALSSIPPLWELVADDFESGSLSAWGKVSPEDLSLLPGGGIGGSTGLSVAVDGGESYLYQSRIARAEEGYLTFWFNPNGVSIPDAGTSYIPGKSVRIANVKGSQSWYVLVALRVRRPTGQGYKAYLEWRAPAGNQFDYASGEFDLVDGWQEITLGFHVDQWVAVWLNGNLVRRIDSVDHQEALGEIIEIGKTNSSTGVSPSGSVRYDSVVFQIPRLDDLWVDAIHGDDANDGLTASTPFRTIQRAADLAGQGTVVHILPGVYRETVRPASSGSQGDPIRYVAEQGRGTAIIRGSEPASGLTWTRLDANTIGLPPGVAPTQIYFADLSPWDLGGPPRFVVQLDGGGSEGVRLPLAREPDWGVPSEWKVHEFWWAADGGSQVAACSPAVDSNHNCDYASRSLTQLTDRTDDAEPAGIEPGNLTTLGDLTGATLVAVDTKQGHYVYRRTIVAHDVGAGRVTVDEICEHDSGSGDPGLGWGSKYYVEGKPYLLDTPGEWWYDVGSSRLYLWPLSNQNPSGAEIEISRRDVGFDLSHRSYTILDGLTLEFFDGSALLQANGYGDRSYGNSVLNVTVRYANYGLQVEQTVRADSSAGNITRGLTLEGSEIAYIDTNAIRLIPWWENSADPNSFARSGVVDTVIRGNELHHLGFRSDSDNPVGAVFWFADRLRFEDNHVHHVAQNGVQFLKSVIQSPKSYGFAPNEIKTGQILIKDNVFEKACQLTTDCGALKIWGDAPDSHVFRDLLIVGNVFRDTFGWTYVSEKRGLWRGGSSSDVRGMGGFGLYVDMASGVHAYRNVAYNNAYAGFMFAGVWRDGDMIFYNNVAANSLFGFLLVSSSFDTHGGSVNTRLVDNIMVNNEAYGILQDENDGIYGNLTMDHNLYSDNGWRPSEEGGLSRPGAMAIYFDHAPSVYYQTLAEIQAQTPWEDHGLAGDPLFWSYDPADHNLFDGSWPDFHPTAGSHLIIDRGTTDLPDSLQAMLAAFAVEDPWSGVALDIGRYEAGFALLATPWMRGVLPGGVAHYTVRLHPSDLPFAVTLSTSSPSPDLTLSIQPAVIERDDLAILNVADAHPEPVPSTGLLYTLPLVGTGGGFERSISLRLLVGGPRVYLPLVSR
jgi:hypothetical protein